MADQPLISDRTIASVRGITERLMRDLASVYRVSSQDSDGLLGTVPTYTLLDAAICYYAAPTAQEADTAQAQGVVADYVLRLPALTDVRKEDQVVLEDSETGEVHHLEVNYVKKRTREFMCVAMCAELT